MVPAWSDSGGKTNIGDVSVVELMVGGDGVMDQLNVNDDELLGAQSAGDASAVMMVVDCAVVVMVVALIFTEGIGKGDLTTYSI